MKKTRGMKRIEQEVGKPIEQYLTELYERHGSQTEVARQLGIDQGTLSVWLVKLRMKQVYRLVPETQIMESASA